MRSFDIEFKMTTGLRVGLWYFDYRQWDEVDYNMVICFDLGFFSMLVWFDPKDE